MKTEEANRLKDKNASHSIDSFNANVVVFANQKRFKGKGKKNSRNKDNRKNSLTSTKVTTKFKKRRLLAMFMACLVTKHTNAI